MWNIQSRLACPSPPVSTTSFRSGGSRSIIIVALSVTPSGTEVGDRCKPRSRPGSRGWADTACEWRGNGHVVPVGSDRRCRGRMILLLVHPYALCLSLSSLSLHFLLFSVSSIPQANSIPSLALIIPLEHHSSAQIFAGFFPCSLVPPKSVMRSSSGSVFAWVNPATVGPLI